MRGILEPSIREQNMEMLTRVFAENGVSEERQAECLGKLKALDTVLYRIEYKSVTVPAILTKVEP